MEIILMLLALALSGAWAGVRLAFRARGESRRLRTLNTTLEDRVEPWRPPTNRPGVWPPPTPPRPTFWRACRMSCAPR